MKAPDAFRTISEVAEELDLPQHVLRFWETRFPQIKPMKRGGGRRYYRPDDIDLLRGIRILLYAEGFTIRGVQRLLKENGVSFVASVGQNGSAPRPSAGAWDEAPEPEHTSHVGSLGDPEDDIFAFPSDADAATGSGEVVSEQAVRGNLTETRIARESQALPEPAMPPTSESRRSLQSVLADLEEAQRLLEQVR